LSFGPASRKPVIVGFSDIFVDITAKFFRTIGGSTNIELAFIDQKIRWIAVLQFASAHVISAEASILRNISGRILGKRDFVDHGNKIVDRTPEPGLNCRVAFDGLVTGKVGNWVVSLQNYTVAVKVQPGLPGGLGGFFGQDDDPIVCCDSIPIPGQTGRIEDNGNRNCSDETRKKRDPWRFHNSIVLLSGLEYKLGGRNVIHTVWVNFTVEVRLATASDENLSAFLGETLSGAETNAGAAASYDCYFTFEFSVHKHRRHNLQRSLRNL
jgi:hypothetical protein